MVEREKQLFPDERLDKFKKFAAQLAQWDQEIVEIIAIRDSVEGEGGRSGKVNLVCYFNPEPLGNHHACLRVINLLLRDEYEKISQGLGIDQPFDFGFVMSCEVFLPSVKILNSLEDGLVLWSADGMERQL